jgi:putative membrane protein
MDSNQRIVLEEIEAPAPVIEPAAAGRTELEPVPEQPAASVEEGEANGTERAAPRWQRRLLIAGGALAGVLVVLQSALELYRTWQESPLLGAGWAIAFACVLGASGRALWRMLRRLMSLRTREHMRERADAMLAHNGVAEAHAFCEALAAQSGAQGSAEYRRWQEQVSATHNNREVLAMYSHLVLTAADRRALEQVVKHAGDVTVMVAISRYPAMDMLFVLWRQLRLVEQIANAYGIDPGYWGRIRLLRDVLRNMAFAGAAEIATEVGTEVLGAGLTAKLSAAAAQGIAAGILTARFGIRAMDACRAIPWSEGERPGVREVGVGVVDKAKGYIKGQDIEE